MSTSMATRGEHVGLVAGEVFFFDEEADHVFDGELGGLLEVFAEAHGDVGGGGFGAGPAEFGSMLRVLVDDEAEGAGEVGFEGGDVDLSVALPGVAVASFEERALGGYGDVEGGAGDELLVIHVAGVGVGRGAVDAGRSAGCYAHGAEEGVERDVDAGGEVGEHPVAVERDDFGFAVGELLREEAAAEAEAVAGEVGVEVDFEDLAPRGRRRVRLLRWRRGR